MFTHMYAHLYDACIYITQSLRCARKEEGDREEGEEEEKRRHGSVNEPFIYHANTEL